MCKITRIYHHRCGHTEINKRICHTPPSIIDAIKSRLLCVSSEEHVKRESIQTDTMCMLCLPMRREVLGSRRLASMVNLSETEAANSQNTQRRSRVNGARGPSDQINNDETDSVEDEVIQEGTALDKNQTDNAAKNLKPNSAGDIFQRPAYNPYEFEDSSMSVASQYLPEVQYPARTSSRQRVNDRVATTHHLKVPVGPRGQIPTEIRRDEEDHPRREVHRPRQINSITKRYLEELASRERYRSTSENFELMDMYSQQEYVLPTSQPSGQNNQTIRQNHVGLPIIKEEEEANYGPHDYPETSGIYSNQDQSLWTDITAHTFELPGPSRQHPVL